MFMLTDLLLFLNTLALAWLVLAPGRYLVNTDRIADNLAAQLLKDYQGRLHTLENVEGYVREQYMQLVAMWGLPAGAVGKVTRRVLAILQDSQAGFVPDTVQPGFSFYG